MPYTYPFKDADEKTELAVWEKGRIIEQDDKKYDSSIWRWDICGHVMKYPEHGNTNSKYGWEIDHIKPTSIGGTDALSNLQPLNWQNNRSKGDTYPWSGP